MVCTLAMAEIPLTVVILTYNEEKGLRRALDSVCGWALEVLVVDSGSLDRTVPVCRSYPKVRVYHHPFEDYGRQWNWALDHLPISTEWVMKLDADESVPPTTRTVIADAICHAAGNVAAFALCRKFVFMGKWLRHTVGKCYDVRVWRHGRARFESRSVNEHLIVDGKVAYLREPLLHEDQKGLSAWVWRHNRYSTLEAQEYFRREVPGAGSISGRSIRLRRLVKQRIWPWVPCKPLVHFLHVYVLRLGFLDGWQGLAYAKLRYFYYYLIELKKREHRSPAESHSAGE